MNRFAVFMGFIGLMLCMTVNPGIAAQGGLGAGGPGSGRGGGFPGIRGNDRSFSGGKPSDPGKPSDVGKPPRGEGADVRGLGKEAGGSVGKKTVGDLLAQNTKLSSRLEGLLPPGTNLEEASNGFEHLGQFVSAAHGSKNLGIPFDQLKGKLTTGKSLGQAIHELKPGVDARKEAIKANEQALGDMEKSLPH